MKRILGALLFAWILFLLVHAAHGNDAIASKVLSNASVRVVATDGNSQYLGSGGYIGHRMVLTAAHVTRGTRQVHIVTRRGTRIPASVVAQDSSVDVSLLALSADPKLQPLPIAGKNPQRGERIYFAGFGGMHQRFRIVKGNAVHYVSPMSGPQGAWFETTYQARQGDSGGPTINAAGQLVGPLWGAGGNSTTSSATWTTRRFLTHSASSYRVPTPLRNGLRLLVGLPRLDARANWFS